MGWGCVECEDTTIHHLTTIDHLVDGKQDIVCVLLRCWGMLMMRGNGECGWDGDIAALLLWVMTNGWEKREKRGSWWWTDCCYDAVVLYIIPG